MNTRLLLDYRKEERRRPRHLPIHKHRRSRLHNVLLRQPFPLFHGPMHCGLHPLHHAWAACHTLVRRKLPALPNTAGRASALRASKPGTPPATVQRLSVAIVSSQDGKGLCDAAFLLYNYYYRIKRANTLCFLRYLGKGFGHMSFDCPI